MKKAAQGINKKSNSEIAKKIIESIEYAIIFAVIGFIEYYCLKNR